MKGGGGKGPGRSWAEGGWLFGGCSAGPILRSQGDSLSNDFALRARGLSVRLQRACLKMGRGSVWERRVRLARREEEADPQRSVTDKQRRQRALPSQTLRAAGLSGLDCVGSGGTDRRRSAPPLTALPNPEFPSRRTPPHFQTGSKLAPAWSRCASVAVHGPLTTDLGLLHAG
jgi:hypothetical protein